jgi:hypothetical protein
LELDWGEEREKIGFIIRKAIGVGIGAASGFVGGRERSESSFGDGTTRLGFSRRGATLEDFSNAPGASHWSRGGEEGLRKSEPEFEGISGKGNTGVKDGGVDSRTKSKVG